jgi:site-specific DNA recombinase
MEASAAQEERIKILQRTIPKEIGYALKGYFMGMPPIGLRLETQNGRKYVIKDERSSHFIVRAFELAAKGLPLTDVCDAINALGFKSKKGKLMRKNYIATVLRNPLYAGILKNKWTRDECIPLKGEQLVSVDLWNQVNARWNEKLVKDSTDKWELINTKPKTKRGYESDKPDMYPLKHIMTCEVCGKRIKTSSTRSKNGTHHPAYHCERNHKRISFNAKKAHTVLKDLLQKQSISPIVSELVMEMTRKLWEAKVKEASKDDEHLKKHVQELQKQLNNITDKMLNIRSEGLLASFEQKYTDTEEKIKKVQREQAKPKMFNSDEINDILPLVKKTIEHPAKIIFDASNKAILQSIAPLILAKDITITSLKNGTPEWSVFMRDNAHKKTQEGRWQDI